MNDDGIMDFGFDTTRFRRHPSTDAANAPDDGAQ
jgi:hypothetical protein